MQRQQAAATLKRMVDAGKPSAPGFKRGIAILITVASVTAAAAAWRAEDRARIAEEQDRDGFAQGVALEQAKADISSDLQDVVVDYARARSLQAEARALRAEAARAAQPERAVLEAQADVDEARAGGILDSINPDAFVKGSGGRLVTATSLTGQRPGDDSKLQIDLRFKRTVQDLAAEPEFEEANRSFTRSDLDVGLAALAVAAAFFFTLVQVSRRRVMYLYLSAGLAALVFSIVALMVVELG